MPYAQIAEELRTAVRCSRRVALRATKGMTANRKKDFNRIYAETLTANVLTIAEHVGGDTASEARLTAYEAAPKNYEAQTEKRLHEARLTASGDEPFFGRAEMILRRFEEKAKKYAEQGCCRRKAVAK